MLAVIRRAYTAFRSPIVRSRPFHRRPRVDGRRLPNLTDQQQRIYDRGVGFLLNHYIPTTGERGR